LRAQKVDIDPGVGKQRPHRATLLIEQGSHQVYRFDKLVVSADR